MTAGLASTPGERIRAGRILVIDDSAFFRGLLAEMLEADGHEVLGAGDLRSAMVHLEAPDPPDLVLLDLVLSGTDGRRLLAEIRSRFTAQELPVLVLTEVVTSAQDLDRLADLGCDGALNKLAPPDHVRFRVRSTLHPATRNERSGDRVALSLGVRYRVVSGACFGRTHTLSPDGVFVRSAQPPPLGAQLELQLEIGDPPQLLLAAGEVVRSDEAPEDERSPRGFAVRFTKLTAADRAVLADWLARIRDRGI